MFDFRLADVWVGDSEHLIDNTGYRVYNVIKANKMETPVRENDFIEDIGEVIGYVEAFAESKIQLAKLEVAEKVATTTASLTTGIILLTLVPVFLCVLSAALGFTLVESFGWSFANSFFALSGFYLIIGVLLVRFRGILFTNPILETVIKKIFAK